MRPPRTSFVPPVARSRRRPLWVAAALLLVLAIGCGRREPAPRPPTAADAELARAWAGVRALAARPAERLTDAEVITLGYVERLRLGMGSPFRLADYALQDPRLEPAARTRTALALLHATREGLGYDVDPRALSLVGMDSTGRAAGTSRMHMALIHHAVEDADDPRAGELAVRAAYQVARAEHLVSAQAATLAAQAAALARDRTLARRDAERLLARADSADRHPLALLREWRAARRFQVEAPTGDARPPWLEVRASALALPVAARIRAVAARIRAVAAGAGAPRRERVPIPRLSVDAARRLTVLARRHDPPPSAPIGVTLDRYGAELRRALGGTREGQQAVEEFLARGRTEERFAAELARLVDGAHPHPRVALVALESAVALRAYAQEAVWYPGFAAPSRADLRRAYGLKAVDFDDDVPAHWRSYYRRMLGESLHDLESVLPGLDLHGLSFRFGRTGREGGTIAIHFPGSRRIHLPPESGPGTIAHEVAHDLDWQVARDRYDRRGAYATDLALHRGGADHFAAAVRMLPLGSTSRRPSPEGRAYDARPAEAFARLFDGFVTATLAARGRSNGYLSSLQDDVLTGHGTAVAPDARRPGAEAFLPLLMVASPLTEREAANFRMRWGARRPPGPFNLLEDVAAAGDGEVTLRRRPWLSLVEVASLDDEVRARITDVQRARAEALRTRARVVCANPFLSPVADGEAAVRALVDAAADARIRGILRRFARGRGIGADPEALRAAWVDAPGPLAEDLIGVACTDGGG